ncbi:DUF3991 and TOPRIM domain-containing protein [Acidisoma cellulosilytica]|uniref:DUF3991 and TOPRIM domain-containing protein n=1 Tax=Acidisoma cellulosilyticum TaxID=2802395 RepID=A0A964E5Q7_9PROT|nr:DUF3991 and toprim domain-containing protein [Acidisoma cellulosilyticum]MCB8882945.1 DUF3991 and TOPRIM domain-containing protein [Acidisoma cellulosilyticum]
MNEDAELDLFRAQVNCAAVLENMGQPWRLDKAESTRRALKYRRAEDEVLIIIHDGRGWFDPLSTAQGDVFKLVQHLEPNLNFGHVRKVLRRFVGITPRYIPAERTRKGKRAADQPVPVRWEKRPRLRPGSHAWRYLLEARGLPADVLYAAGEQDIIRDGAYSSAWFAHRERAEVTHVEIRGPDFKGSLTGGRKKLFRFQFGAAPITRLVIAEAPIDALSVAALEGKRTDSFYVATGGGMGPGTLAALEAICADLSQRPGSIVESAADANRAGDRFAERHAGIAQAAGVAFRRLRPPDDLDWNDVLKRGRGA